jgi:pimeloyl-ACP methyl ester carboxylesterase
MYVHGLGASSRYWSVLADKAPAHAGVAPDLLGFGRSPKPPNSTYDVAAHLERLLPIVPMNAVVVGHSTGAILASAIARAAAGRVRALLLLGLPAFSDEATARREVGRLGTMARLTTSGNWAAQAMCMAMCELRPFLIPIAPKLVRDVPAEVASDFLRHSWPSYSRTLRNVVLRHPAVSDLEQLRLRVVLLHGKADRDAPIELVEEAARTLRNADRDVTLHVIEGDHHLALRRPEIVAAHLGDLLL